MGKKYEYFEFVKGGHGARKTATVDSVDITFPQLLTLFLEFAQGCGYDQSLINKVTYEGRDDFHQYFD